MNKTALLLCLFAAAVSTLIVSCKKDSDSGSNTPSASVKDTTQTVNESVGTASVIVNLSAAASQAIKLNFTLTGTAILNGDYEPDSTSSITIPAGATSGTLKFTIFGDQVTESAKTIHVKFTSSGNVTLSSSEATIHIQDNDPSRASTGFVTDLTWDAGSLVDLDLFVADTIVIDTVTQTITSVHLVDSSENAKGFESVLINNASPDGDYALIVLYAEGSRNVNFHADLNAPNVSGGTLDDTFLASDVQSGFLYGPIHKLGSNYTFKQSGVIFDLSKLRRYVIHGPIR